MITLHRLGPDDLRLLDEVAEDVFDHAVEQAQAAAFLADPAHEIVVARDGGRVVGFASGTVLLHPDKPPAFFVAELGVAPAHRRRGLATRLMERLIAVARGRGCRGIWVATEDDNAPARALYAALGGRETAGVVVYDWDGAMDRDPRPRTG